MKPKTFFARRLFGRSALVATISGFAVATLGLATAQAYTWEYNNFDSDLGNWNVLYNNTANGNNVDWRNSNLAGGTAGELGGVFARHTTTAMVARYFDFTLTFNDPLHWTGVWSSANTYLTWNSSVFIGYFNADQAAAEGLVDYIGWRNREPNDNTTPGDNYRARARIGVQGNISSPNDQYVNGQSYAFDVQWVPTGLGDGSGTFSGDIGGWLFSQAYGAQSSGAGFNAFGIWWDESAIDANVKFDTYFDNVAYLIPEPSASLLAGLGILGLWFGRRARHARPN